MPALDAQRSVHRFYAVLCALLCLLTGLSGCAALTGQEPLRVSVAGIDPLQGEGMEMRFNVRLRVQNPNDSPVEYSGVSLQLDLNGQSFASGVSDQRGVVPRFGETVIGVPLTVPAFAAVRQAFAFAGSAQAGSVPYEIRGRLAGGFGGGARFAAQGRLSLPTSSVMGP